MKVKARVRTKSKEEETKKKKIMTHETPSASSDNICSLASGGDLLSLMAAAAGKESKQQHQTEADQGLAANRGISIMVATPTSFLLNPTNCSLSGARKSLSSSRLSSAAGSGYNSNSDDDDDDHDDNSDSPHLSVVCSSGEQVTLNLEDERRRRTRRRTTARQRRTLAADRAEAGGGGHLLDGVSANHLQKASGSSAARCSQSKTPSLLSIEQPAILPRTFSASALQGSRPLRLTTRHTNHQQQQQPTRFSFWESMAAGCDLTASRWQMAGAGLASNLQQQQQQLEGVNFNFGAKKR